VGATKARSHQLIAGLIPGRIQSAPKAHQGPVSINLVAQVGGVVSTFSYAHFSILPLF